MDHLQSFIHNFIQIHGDSKPGLNSFLTCIISALFAFINAFITLTQLHTLQVVMAILASLVALVSGGFAIYYYRLQIKKTKENV
jgi:glucan phosphoethanolaminetransferase (alkaline phosphatase superfamily)